VPGRRRAVSDLASQRRDGAALFGFISMRPAQIGADDLGQGTFRPGSVR
jgi:hypothetical protein